MNWPSKSEICRNRIILLLFLSADFDEIFIISALCNDKSLPLAFHICMVRNRSDELCNV